MSYKIGSFNLLDFNLKSDEESKKNFEKISEIIIKENFDILVVQELLAPFAMKTLVDVLNKNRKFNQQWCYCYGDSKSRNEHKNEYPSFIWNAKRIELLHLENKQNPITIDNIQIKDAPGQTRFLRFPVMARFKPLKRDFEIRLINIHIRSSKGSRDFGVEFGEKAMRMNEFNTLAKYVLTKMTDQVSPLSTKTAYTFLVGDYNINLWRDGYDYPCIPIGDVIFATERNGNQRPIKTIQDKKTSLKKIDDDQEITEDIYANNFDHFSFDVNKTEHVIWDSSERIEVVEKYYNKDLRKYRYEVSDHVPIFVEINA